MSEHGGSVSGLGAPASALAGPATPTGTNRGRPVTAPLRRSLLDDAGGWWPGIAGALGLFALTRVVQLALISWMLPDGGPGVRSKLLAWDAGWFVRVATEGYPHGYTYDDAGTLVGNGLAFFPVYPLLIRLVSATGADPTTAAILVAWLGGAAASVLLHLLGTSLYHRRVGYALVVLCCAQPMSVVFSLAYSEGVFVALVAGMLLAAHRRCWFAAGLLGLAAGLTRPTGAAAAVALTVAAALAWRYPVPGERRWAAPAAAAVALAGVPAFLVWAGLRVGDLDAWFRIQAAGWGTAFDFGRSVAAFATSTLGGGEGWVPISIVWLIAAAVAAAAIAVTHPVWPPLTVYGLFVLALAVGQAGYYHSKPRLLVPVLLVLVPAALAAARAPTRTAVLALAGYAAFGLWYGAYLVAVWPYTI